MTNHPTGLRKASQGSLLPSDGLVRTSTARQVSCQGAPLGEQGGKVSQRRQPGRHFSQFPVLEEPRLADLVLFTSGKGCLPASGGVMLVINLSQLS